MNVKSIIKLYKSYRKSIKLSKVLEIAITDFCNLSCVLCSQGTPYQKDKRYITLNDIRKISKLIKPYEFDMIKISGGEPTMHKEFGEICYELRNLFKADLYLLATNGYLLSHYIESVKVFDEIELSYYTHLNVTQIEECCDLLDNIRVVVKRDDKEMVDFRNNSISHNGKSQKCKWLHVKKIVQNRIYPCCLLFGQSVYKGWDNSVFSAELNNDWRTNLKYIEKNILQYYCEKCGGYSILI